MKCPQCGGTNFTTCEYDFGRCMETGYHDAGERYRCFDCRSEGDVDELIQDDEEDGEPSSQSAPGEGSEPYFERRQRWVEGKWNG